MCKSIAEGGQRCQGHLKKMSVRSFGPPDLAWMPDQQNTPSLIIATYGKSGAAALNLLLNANRVERTVTASVGSSAPGNWRVSGLEYRLKSPSSLAAKVALKSDSLGLRPDVVAPAINDVLRYTIVSPTADWFKDGVQQSLQSVIRDGNRIEGIENSFVLGNPYMGVHAVSEDGVGFEVQYHTAESLAAKNQTHVLYELARDPSASLEDRRRAFDAMAATFADVEIPKGIDAIEVSAIRVVRKIYRRPGGA